MGSRVGHLTRGGGGKAYRAATWQEGVGGGPTRWLFEAEANSGGRRWLTASPGDCGG
jgi:hypothetical protein